MAGKLRFQTFFINPGSPWENGYIESFIGKLRNECLNREIFRNGREATWQTSLTGSMGRVVLGLPLPGMSSSLETAWDLSGDIPRPPQHKHTCERLLGIPQGSWKWHRYFFQLASVQEFQRYLAP